MRQFFGSSPYTGLSKTPALKEIYSGQSVCAPEKSDKNPGFSRHFLPCRLWNQSFRFGGVLAVSQTPTIRWRSPAVGFHGRTLSIMRTYRAVDAWRGLTSTFTRMSGSTLYQLRFNSKCHTRIARLAELGNELRRPEADFLTDGIYELRASYQGIHYRLLYFFSGQSVVVLSHGLAKESEVPAREIDVAIKRKENVAADFNRYTFKPKEPEV